MRRGKQEVVDRPAKIPWWVWSAIEDRTPDRKIMVVGGLGAGKSYGAQIWDVARSLENGGSMSDEKPTRSWTVAPNYRICETLFELTLEVSQKVFGLEQGKHYKVKRSFPREIDFSPGNINHRIVFLSADRPEHFVSESLTHARWSEVGVSKELVYEKLEDRVRDVRSKVLQSLYDGTPESTDNLWYNLAGFGGASSDVVDEERNFRKFRVETSDNAANLAPGYIPSLRDRYAYSPEKLKSYELGLFVRLDRSGAYPEFVESRNVINPVEPEKHLPLLFCWDFNISPLAWVVCQKVWQQKNYYSPRTEQFIALQESSGEGRGLLDTVAEFAARFPVATFGDTRIEIYGDASGFADSWKVTASDYQTIEQYLRSLGYRRVEVCGMKSNPEIRQRLERVGALMAYGKFVVSSDCRKLISGFTKTTLKDGTWKIEKPTGEDWTHYPDAVGYMLYEVTRNQNLVDPNYKPILGTAL